MLTFVHTNNLQLVQIFKIVGKMHSIVPCIEHVPKTLKNSPQTSATKAS
jgi:hypothetical protein